MKKFFVMQALIITMVLMLMGGVAAQAPLEGEMELDFYPENPIWRGTITGDISGNMYFTNVGPGRRGEELRGQTVSFEEVWLITDAEDNMILAGTDEGIVSPNSKYRMNGVVTEAAPEYSHLVGRTVHMSGYITWDPGTGAPLTAPGTFRIN